MVLRIVIVPSAFLSTTGFTFWRARCLVVASPVLLPTALTEKKSRKREKGGGRGVRLPAIKNNSTEIRGEEFFRGGFEIARDAIMVQPPCCARQDTEGVRH